MLKNFFGIGEGADAPHGKRSRITVLAVAAAILLLAFGGKGTEKSSRAADKEEKTGVDIAEYTEEVETRLSNILSKISGAGQIDVMVTFDTAYERVPAKNERADTAKSTDGEKVSETDKTETSIQVFGSGNARQPYVLKEKLPIPSGVAVAASGAGNERVRLEIYEAVKALYGISGNRIKVAVGTEASGK